MEGKPCADGAASPPSAPSPQATRVESLFHLVKDGSCVDVRENAAEKLGEIALQSPVYCKSILRQIRVLLVDKEWAVRVAAAKCLDVIAHSFQNDPSLCSSVALRFARASFAGREASCPHLNCRTVNIETVIDGGAPLLRSGGEEYEYQINLSDDQRKLQAVRQRQLLLRRICGGAAAEGLWKTGEDSLAQHMLPRLNSEHVKELADDIEASEVAHNGTRSISTEATQRKRAAEMLPDQHRMAKKTKEEDLESERDEPEGVDLVALLVADLFESVFDSTWEVRHGSFAALRHILLSSGLTTNVPHEKDVKDVMVIDLWIEESLMRCLCVLALDQFVDYSADGSVAPVRELTAQVFGILLGSLHDQELLQAYLVVLRKLLQAASWHTSHGGLLGIKYLLHAHTAHAAALVPLVAQDVVAMVEVKRRGAEEDVLLVASGILGDMAPHLDSVNPTLLRRAARSLWLIATATRTATGSMVASATIQTLQRWYQCASIAKVLRGMSDASLLWDQLARIVPLLHHHDQAVRVATAACIKALVGESDRQLEISGTARETLRYLLSHVLLQLLCDDQDDARVMVLLCWAAVVEWCAAADRLVEMMEDLVPQWLEIVWGLDSVTVLNRSRETEPDDTVSSSISMPSKENLAARVAYAEAVGILLSHIPLVSEAYEAAIKQVTQSIESLSGEQQCGSLLLLYWWAVHSKKKGETKGQNPLAILRGRVGETLEALAQRNWIPKAASSSFYYVEQAGSLQRVLRMERRLLEIFETAKICISPSKDSTDSLHSCAVVSRQVAERITQYPYSRLASSPHAFEQAHFSRQDLFLLDDVIQQASSRFYARVQGIGSCAYSYVFVLPTKKSGFLVKALMDAIKTEENSTVRGLTAETLAQFVISQVDFQRKCVSKIISNLCNSAVALAYRETDEEETSTAGGEEDRTRHLLKVRVQGAETALQAIAHASKSLNSLPILPEVVTRGYRVDGIQWTDKLMQENARLVAVLVPSLGTTSIRFAVKWLDELSQVIGETFEYECTRHAVAYAIAHICGKLSINQLRPEAEAAMAILYQKLFSGHAQDDDQSTLSGKSRRLAAGSIMVLDRLVIEMGSQLTPYVPSLLHFAMRAMQAAESTVRTLAAKAFADLLPLMPLQMDLISSHIHNPQLQKVLHENQSSRAFFERLLQGKAIATVSVATVLSASFSLRAYQQHGVDWLAFLVENRMGGVLADDMGLGKTIQLLATIASSISKKSKTSSLSLIVCPPIVVHHWITEAARCFPGVFADILEYSGPVAKRKAMLSRVRNANGPVLLVATYAAVRSDRDLLKALPYDFAVLDEAHLIRNPKSALFDAVCALRAIHRFVLSGTPLQNHVGDLWALFTFLMPGYLGDYADFRRDFELPISKSRERTATPKQKELAAHAINTLHQRVLPFILRRTKDTVLKELPPKIISNILLPLTPLQQRLYKAATTCDSQANTPGTKDGGALPGVLRQLQLLKKICVHPALVQDEDVMINEATASEKDSLLNWKHSGKMIGLRDLLVESCDLGRDETDSGEVLGKNHRCLVFAHLTETLDVVQTMLTQALPKVTSFRLDGKTPIAKRQGIVAAFNEDPSIDLLLLTTAVGGLGLTLTGADTVIFVEHSWNPFVDLQAMDRAHRIGQKKTVRVFRLIMEASLEEHIMDLQAFKEQVAQTVVTTTEASTSMNANTKNVLHLLQTSSTAVKAQEAAVHAQAHSRKLKQGESGVGIPGVAVELLHQIGELWDQSQYDSLAFPPMP